LRHTLRIDDEALHAARQLLQLLDHHKRLDFEVWHVASAWSTSGGRPTYCHAHMATIATNDCNQGS
jgi:hypothetical protein